MDKKEPRALDEIKKEHGHVMWQIGAKNYQVEVLKAELNQLYQSAQRLNIEASEAVLKAPDAGQAPTEPTQPTSEVQNAN